jgi:hypothetical protein
MTAAADVGERPTIPDRTFEFVTTLEAAVDARALFGNRLARVDLIVDVVALIAGAVWFALGQALGLLLVMGALLFLLFGRRIQALILGYRARSMVGKRTTMRVDDQALHVANELGSMDIPWSSLTDVRSDRRSVIFVRDRLLAFYMPVSVFSSPAERSAFVRFASERIAASRSRAS